MAGGEPAPEPAGVVANTFFGLVGQVVTAGFTAALTLYLVRALGPHEFGVFSLALSVSSIAIVLADFGIATAVSMFTARERENPAELRRVTDAALRLKVIGSAVIAVALVLLAPVIASAYGEPGLTWPLRAVAASLFLESQLMLYTSVFGALLRVAVNTRVIFWESLVEATASISLVVLGLGAAGALLGRAVGYAVGLGLAMLLLSRAIGRPSLRRDVDRDLQRSILAYARPLIILGSAYVIYNYLDALLIGALLSARDVGEFAAPMRFIVLAGYVGQAVGSAIAPRLAGDSPDTTTFMVGLRLMLLVQALIVVPLLVWADPIIDLLLGPGYREAPAVMQTLTPYTFLLGLAPLITQSTIFIGAAGRRVRIVMASLALNAAVDLALLPVIGVEGAAIGTSLAFALYVPAHLRLCSTTLDLHLGVLLPTVLRSLLAAVAAGGVLLAIGTRDLSAAQWALGVVGCPAAYLGVLVATRELGRDDLRDLRTLRQ